MEAQGTAVGTYYLYFIMDKRATFFSPKMRNGTVKKIPENSRHIG